MIRLKYGQIQADNQDLFIHRTELSDTPMIKPPAAMRRSHRITAHGDVRDDPYYWLRDRDNPEVIAYLEAENQYADKVMAHTRELRQQIFSELKSRVVDDDMSAPVKDGNYEYYCRDRKSDNYLRHYRRQAGEPETEQLLLDENELADSHNFFRLSGFEISPDDCILAYATDTKGSERFTIRFMRLADRTLLSEQIDGASGDIVWSEASSCVYYTALNDANRPHRLFRHRLGDAPEHDRLIYEEEDEAFYMHIAATNSRRYICLELSANSTNEVHLIESFNDEAEPFMIFPRAAGIEYSVADRDADLYVLTNDNAVNFRLMRTSMASIDQASWRTVIAHSATTTLTGFTVFRDFIAVAERCEGLPSVRILNCDASQFQVEKPSQVQELRIGTNLEYDTRICRLNASSLLLPHSQYDCDMQTGELTHVKTKLIGNYSPPDYEIEHHTATSADGTSVPIYLIAKKGAAADRPAPLLLYAYGSYGISLPLSFSAARLPLLERGIAFAIAHIRGGGEFGRSWYLDGKLKNKKHTFEDFNACADYLIEAGITSPAKLAIEGGSAGGLVVGNYLMTRGGRCRAALAHVPFVDVVTTMLDESLPLTVIERDEWGNPNEPEYYRYIKSYSPYDNVTAGEYPALYISGGLHDTRVGFWEPAKWAAKIRHCNTGGRPAVLRTEMHSGHSGKSGRDGSFAETAIECAFVIDQLLGDATA